MEARQLALAITTGAVQIAAMRLACLAAERLLSTAGVTDIVATHARAVALDTLEFARTMTMVAFYQTLSVAIIALPRTSIITGLTRQLYLTRISTAATGLCLYTNYCHYG